MTVSPTARLLPTCDSSCGHDEYNLTLAVTCRNTADVTVEDSHCDAVLRPCGEVLCAPTMPWSVSSTAR